MANSYNSLCDDFYVDMTVNTELDLPSSRDTILSFFERIQKQLPGMGNFYRKESGDFCLEEERLGEKYRWVTLELDRICCSCANPVNLEDAYDLDTQVLELIPYMLGVSHLDIDCLDLTFTMDFDFIGNQDDVIADALFTPTPFSSLLDIENARPIGFSPTAMIALGEDCRTQARLSIESRTTVYEIRNEKYKPDEPISLYFTVRRYPDPKVRFDPLESFRSQCALAEQLMADKIIPNFVKPLISAISQRR